MKCEEWPIKVYLFVRALRTFFEMAETSSFVAKPARGWLHPDTILATDGITYAVRVSS